MIKSKILYKSMLVVSVIIFTYTFALLLIVLPRVEKSTQYLEEKNGKEVLNKLSLVTKNMQTNLENFQKSALQYHKTELKNLTSVFWSIVQAKYEQSRPEKIGSILEKRGNRFKKDLTNFYNQNKNTLSKEELKQAIINYVNIFRYDHGAGYFFIHKQTTVVEHPIHPESNGQDFADIKDQNGVYFVREFYNICKEKGAGILHYQWKQPQTEATEERVAYVFTFEPFDWIIGTSGSIKDLQASLKNEVIYLAKTIRYNQDNYFFITSYDYKVIAHPNIKEGVDFSTVQDSHGHIFVPPMVDNARKNGEGFTRYWWRKDPSREETSEKLTFSKDFPDWKMVISTGTFIDDIQREIDKQKAELIDQLRQTMKQTIIGKSGYLFIVDKNGMMVIHPNHKMEGKSIRGMKNPDTGGSIFDDLIRAAKTHQPMLYRWDKPTDQNHFVYDKISWVEYIPGLQWYVASSAYTDEFQETSRGLKTDILFIGLIILLLSFLVSFLFFRKFLKPISILSTLASRVTRGDYSARSPFKSNDEIGSLSLEFNAMIDTIKGNIDTLDQKVAEKTNEIEKQNMLFETLFNESSDGILLIKKGLFVDCNRSAYQLLRYERKEDLISLPPSAISPLKQPDGSDSQKKAKEFIAAALKNGSNRFEWVHLRKDGTPTFFEIVLTRVTIQDELLVHVVWRDINEKKSAQRHLEKTLSEFQAVMSAIDYGIIFMDDKLQARIVNQACRDIWGLPDDFIAEHPTMRELMEFNRYNEVYPVPDDAFDEYMEQREAEVLQGTISPTPFRRKDGITLQYQCVVLSEGWRMLTYFDITELKNTQNKLARAQKMETIGMMAGGVAHDLNNILSGIVSYPELLLLQLPQSSKLRKPIKAIQESGKRAATVVADLLTVARGVASIREPHDLNLLINDYLHSPECKQLQTRYPEVRCTEHLDAQQAVISCSPVHIKKTIMNLTANAVEAVESRGTVRISTTNIEIQHIEKESIPPGHYIVITIQDNGPGIREEDINHIFEPFYSRKVMGRSGTGLGLTVVWNTVEDHDGQIRVKSSQGETCFTLYFPLSEETLPPTDNKQKIILGTTREERILVVDDESLLRDISKQVLLNLGYVVTTADSGEAALDYIRDHPVDLIVLDMLMDPGMNGRQTYEKILELYPEQRAVIASGFSESDEVKAALRLGARRFIKKPYSIEELGQAVKDALKE